MANELGYTERSRILLLTIYDRAHTTGRDLIAKGEVGPSIGLDPDQDFADNREFRRVARMLVDAGYITKQTADYEIMSITPAGIRAVESGTV